LAIVRNEKLIDFSWLRDFSKLDLSLSVLTIFTSKSLKLTKKQVKMPKALPYTAAEKAIAARACLSATQSRKEGDGEVVVGTNQQMGVFIQEFLSNAKALDPDAAVGTSWRRGKAFWEHTRDKIIFDVMNNFMPCYRHTQLAIVTGGLTEQNYVNISVAAMLGKCQGADKDFAEFDAAGAWPNLAAYEVLKVLSKFQFVHGKYGVGDPSTLMKSSVDSMGTGFDESKSRGNGFGKKKTFQMKKYDEASAKRDEERKLLHSQLKKSIKSIVNSNKLGNRMHATSVEISALTHLARLDPSEKANYIAELKSIKEGVKRQIEIIELLDSSDDETSPTIASNKTKSASKSRATPKSAKLVSKKNA
jgi:hypothetical protein